jgi:Zn-dependent M28 family amino/carboxypeptidase
VDGEDCLALVRTQVAAGPRVPGTAGHRETEALIIRHLEATAEVVRVHSFQIISPWDSSEVVLRNILGVFRPESPVRILLGAHWDTRPGADREEDPARRHLPVPGANDGASGTAVLLEVARALADQPPSIGVDLVFFDGEDLGLDGQAETFALGSAGFVRDHPSYRPAFALIVDMVGRAGTRIPREALSAASAGALVEWVWRIGREAGVSVMADSLGGPVYDDHVAFLRAGVPALDLVDLADPAWHTTDDLPANCSPLALEETARWVLAVIAEAERTLSP